MNLEYPVGFGVNSSFSFEPESIDLVFPSVFEMLGIVLFSLESKIKILQFFIFKNNFY